MTDEKQAAAVKREAELKDRTAPPKEDRERGGFVTRDQAEDQDTD